MPTFFKQKRIEIKQTSSHINLIFYLKRIYSFVLQLSTARLGKSGAWNKNITLYEETRNNVSDFLLFSLIDVKKSYKIIIYKKKKSVSERFVNTEDISGGVIIKLI